MLLILLVNLELKSVFSWLLFDFLTTYDDVQVVFEGKIPFLFFFSHHQRQEKRVSAEFKSQFPCFSQSSIHWILNKLRRCHVDFHSCFSSFWFNLWWMTWMNRNYISVSLCIEWEVGSITEHFLSSGNEIPFDFSLASSLLSFCPFVSSLKRFQVRKPTLSESHSSLEFIPSFCYFFVPSSIPDDTCYIVKEGDDKRVGMNEQREKEDLTGRRLKVINSCH